MSFDVTFPLVLLAAYGLCNLLLSAAVVLAWRTGLRRHLIDTDAILGVRLLPAMGSATLVLTVVLPAFLLYEPRHAHDQPGPLLVISALFALLVVGDGIRRGFSAWRATSALVRRSRSFAVGHAGPAGPAGGTGTDVTVIDVKEPLVGVVGGWKQRIVAARCVTSACDHEEFRQVLAHEAAHMDARDNQKLLLVLTLPDALAWLPTGHVLTERWRAAAELEADERASGTDPGKRLALASALIKVARLSIASGRPRAAARASNPFSGLEHRVRRLLAPSPVLHRPFPGRRLVTCALLLPLLAVPLYASVHRIIEALVAFGR
jgi:Zn-dependent protease with chaperone function